MIKKNLSTRLTAGVVGTLLFGVAAAPAYGLESSSVAVGPTDPASLVNDPSSDETSAELAQGTVNIAADGSDLIASFQDEAGGKSYSRSTDGGKTWQDQGPVPSGGRVLSTSGLPLAADHNRGVFYLAASCCTATDPEVFVFRAATGGGPLGRPVVATPTAGGGGFSQSVAVDNFPGRGNGNVYLGYGKGTKVYLVRSVDGGMTWGPLRGTLVSDSSGAGGQRVVVTPDHCVHSVYLDESTFWGEHGAIATRTSCDGGVTFEPAVKVVDIGRSFGGEGDLGVRGHVRTTSNPQVAANPVTGALYVVIGRTVEPRRADVLLTTSTDGGSTWSTPTMVNADKGDGEQFSPTVAVSDDGTKLLITYYDRRRDEWVGVDTQRWGRNGVIDTVTDTVHLLNEFQLGPSFPPVSDSNQGASPDDWSDYEAATFSDGAFVPAWTDNRDGADVCEQTVAYRCLFQADVRSAVVPTGGRTDLSIVMTAPDGAVALGEEYAYTATVSNDSTRLAHNVWLRTELPVAARFMSATTDAIGACYRLNRDVSCQLGTLAAGQSRSMTVTAQALASGPLKRKAVTSTSTAERRNGNNAAAANGTVSVAETTTNVFSTNDISVVIPDRGQAVVPLELTQSPGIALDVNVRVRLHSGFLDGVSMTLVSPAGVEIPLSSGNGNYSLGNYGYGPNSCAGTPAVFDDTSEPSIIDADPPFTHSTNNPEGSLSDAAGGDYGGTWQLVIDQDRGRGTVGCVELQIQHTN